MEMTWQQWKAMKKELRRRFSPTGWTLLVYYVIMNVAVIAWMVAEMILSMIRIFPTGSPDDLEQIAMGAAESGWGYFLAIAIGLLILLLWKKPAFFRYEIFAKGKPMKAGAFFGILCVFMGGQFLSQMMISATELILNFFDLTIINGLEALSVDPDNFSMFLYAGILAPVAEEILFRGLVLRSLMPFGKRFAIFCSAFTFGLFHGNLVQAPFAFLVGLVLGYVAVEYNVCWAMLLHMINNLVVADIFARLTSGLPEMAAGVILSVLLFAFAVAALVILISKRTAIREWRSSEVIHRTYLSCFFSSLGMIVFLIVMGLMMVYSFTLLITPI